jgi:uncharacterized damage-inducible protein DinB
MSSTVTDSELESLRYPIGKFVYSPESPAEDIPSAIDAIEQLPSDLRKAVEDLTDAQLDTPYRPGGWTVRQLVHHLADSHMNSSMRFRWALTEQSPEIKVYDEQAWAKLSDARTAPIEVSLILLGAVHARWTLLLRSMTAEDWKRSFRHPENGETTLEKALAHYHWHGRHHLAQVANLRERMGW